MDWEKWIVDIFFGIIGFVFEYVSTFVGLMIKFMSEIFGKRY